MERLISLFKNLPPDPGLSPDYRPEPEPEPAPSDGQPEYFVQLLEFLRENRQEPLSKAPEADSELLLGASA